jgi:hypothetical protein
MKHVLLWALLAGTAIGAGFVGLYTLRAAAVDVSGYILQSCAEHGYFRFVGRDLRLAEVQCSAPPGSKFRTIDGQLVVEFSQAPDSSRAIRL